GFAGGKPRYRVLQERSWRCKGPRNIGQSDALSRKVFLSEPSSGLCPEENSLWDFPAAVAFSVPVDFFQNSIIFLAPLSGQGACASLQAFAPSLFWRNTSDSDLHFLPIRHAEIFIQFDGSAVHDAVSSSSHGNWLLYHHYNFHRQV